MKANELLEMKLKDILENYCVIYSAECCYTYGITTIDAITSINEKYEIEDEPSFTVETIIPLDYLAEIEEEQEILTEEMMENLIETHLPIERKTLKK